MVRIAPLGRLGIRAVGMVMPSMRPMGGYLSLPASYDDERASASVPEALGTGSTSPRSRSKAKKK